MSTNQLDCTLMDDKWIDTFDRLLEPRPVLRALNIIKKTVNVSYNIDSSVENAESSIEVNSFAYSPTPAVFHLKNGNENKRNSTPVKEYLKPLPFRCSLSPVRSWKFHLFNKHEINWQNNEFSDGTYSIGIENTDELTKTQLNQRKEKNANIIKQTIIEPSDDKWIHFSQCSHVDKNLSRSIDFDDLTTISMRPIRSRNVTIIDQSIIITPGFCTWTNTNTQTTKAQWKPNRQKNANLVGLPIIREPSICTLTNKSNAEDNNSEQTKKLVIRRISKCRKSMSALKTLKNSNNINHTNYCDLVFNRCNQKNPLSFDAFVRDKIHKCRKIGEGVYGEVFMYSKGKSTNDKGFVLKVIPIEGHLQINGEMQKTFEQILPEIVTTIELSNLRVAKLNATDRFVNIKKVSCVTGLYPNHLIKLWKEYDKDVGSENDNPEIFPIDQLYITLELDFGGQDMESYVFNNSQQAYIALNQIILALAVAEEAFEFEHRDLHLGNILVNATTKKNIIYKVNDKKVSVLSGGINITIIDYTLSRMSYNNCCFYNDLSTDEELFEAKGDYQYEVYRQMRQIVQNDWRKYEPKTNIFWILYIIKKMLNGICYKNERTNVHKLYLKKLQHFENIILTYENALGFANYIQNLK